MVTADGGRRPSGIRPARRPPHLVRRL